MNIVTKILPRFAILEIFFEDGDSHAADLSLYVFNGTTARLQARIGNSRSDDIVKEAKGMPLFVAYAGFGIISKNMDANPEIVEKIKSDADSFVWNETATEITFLRRERVEKVVGSYHLDKNIPLAVFCFAGQTPATLQNAALDRSVAFYAQNVNLSTALKPSHTGSILCRLSASKLKLPVFAVLLLILIVNMFVNKSIRTEYNNSQARLWQIEKQRGQQDQAAARNRQMFAEFNRKPPFEYSWLCDRAGLTLPEGITLTLLIIQPVKKTLENGKKPLVEHDRIIIKGQALKTEDITCYTCALGKFIRPVNVRLTSVERNHEMDRLDFAISIDLS